MKVITDRTDEYFVTWKHMISERVTECEIYRYNGDQKITTVKEQSYCSPRDQYCKETGRKLSLTRALKTFTASTRKLFWEAYFNRGAKPIEVKGCTTK
jgi:hypothetical protein